MGDSEADANRYGALDEWPGLTLTFENWKGRLIMELTGAMKMTIVEARDYVRATGDECWREDYDDGMTPREAADEEAHAARE